MKLLLKGLTNTEFSMEYQMDAKTENPVAMNSKI